MTARSAALLAYRRPLGAVCAALCVLAVIAALRAPPPPGVPVLVAARDLPAGTVLGGADLRLARFPAALVPHGALPSASGIVGQILSGAVRAGEALTGDRLLAATALPPGQLSVPVRFPDAGAAATLQPGERIDVLSPAGEAAADLDVLTVAPGGLVLLAASAAQARALAALPDRFTFAVLPG